MRVRALLAGGLERLEARAGGFADLTPEGRLAALDVAGREGADYPWPVFREAALDFTIEAWAGHPERCGNRQRVVWQALGLSVAG